MDKSLTLETDAEGRWLKFGKGSQHFLAHFKNTKICLFVANGHIHADWELMKLDDDDVKFMDGRRISMTRYTSDTFVRVFKRQLGSILRELNS